MWAILTHPADFFRALPVTGGVAAPLAFALVSNWIGTAISFLWGLVIGKAVSEHIGSLVKIMGDVAETEYPGTTAQFADLQERLTHWIWGAGSVIIDPFTTLIQILITSFIVFLGARLFVTPGRDGAPSEITYESALRVVSYGMAPAILAGIPLLGSFVSGLCVMIVTVIAAKEVYRVGYGRAIVVALFPKLIILAIMFSAVFLLVFLVIKAITSI